jgi:hypothetical protein
MGDSPRGKGSQLDPKATIPLGLTNGNELFEAAVVAIGLDSMTTRWLLISVLNSTAVEPASLSPDDLGAALPEIERRLRQLVLPGQADDAMARLRRILLDLAGPDGPSHP